jgi:hypothetical protein
MDEHDAVPLTRVEHIGLPSRWQLLEAARTGTRLAAPAEAGAARREFISTNGTGRWRYSGLS